MPYTYFGEAAGARILRYGVGFSQIGDSYQLDVQTWPLRPAGDVGDVVFRTIEILLRHVLGYDVDVIPIVDGVPQAAQSFGGGAPSGGLQEAVVPIQAYVGMRGNGIAARIRSRTLLGETEVVDVNASFAIIRTTP
jgi:hypothetical protein